MCQGRPCFKLAETPLTRRDFVLFLIGAVKFFTAWFTSQHEKRFKHVFNNPMSSLKKIKSNLLFGTRDTLGRWRSSLGILYDGNKKLNDWTSLIVTQGCSSIPL